MIRQSVVQALLFALISVVAIGFGLRYVSGGTAFADTYRVTAEVDDGRAIGPGVRVSYRGVDVGEIAAAELGGPGGTVRLTMDLDSHTPIPAAAEAIIVTGTALGDKHLDIRPESADGPYLADGDRLLVPEEIQAPPLEDLIFAIDTSVRALDPESLAVIGDSVSESLADNGPVLGALLDDSATLAELLMEQAPTLRGLVTDGLVPFREIANRPGSVSGSVSAVRDVTEGLVRREETLVHLLERSPEAMLRAQTLLDDNHETGASLLTNALVVTDVVGARTPAFAAGLTEGPRGLSGLAGTVHGDRADFSLVATQGPACAYPLPPRLMGDESPREPNLRLYCPPGEDLAQRGSRSAPRPDDLGLTNATEPGTVIGPPMVEEPLLVPTGEEAYEYWRVMLEGLRNGR